MTNRGQNFSTGADIEKISRFRNLKPPKDNLFLDKIYTKNELAYCFKKPAPAQHLAGRFAAKEAVFKALTAAGIRRVPLKKIEISATIDGAPRVQIKGYAKNQPALSLSIAHCREYAIAFALAAYYEESKRKNRL